MPKAKDNAKKAAETVDNRVPTVASQYKRLKSQGEIVSLPGGMVARVKTVNVETMLLSGDIPDLLTPIAAKALFKETEMDDIADDVEVSKEYVALVNTIVPAAFIEPKVVPHGVEPDDDEISVDDLDWVDKLAVFQLAIASVDVLARFRQDQVEMLASRATLEGDGDETE